MEIISLLLIIYTPWGNRLLETAPVPAELWLLLIPCAIGMVALEELRKWAVRRCSLNQNSINFVRRHDVPLVTASWDRLPLERDRDHETTQDQR